MFVDSHCHLDLIDLEPFDSSLENFIEAAKQQQIEHMLCIGIDLESFPAMRDLVAAHTEVSVTVGVHPNVELTDDQEPDTARLLKLAESEKVRGIGETGLDYFRSEGNLQWQQDRFRTHIRAAREAGKPLVVHSRQAREDTVRILREEKAGEAGGVIHCFTEDWPMAEQCLELGFYISFSGIITFKNAQEIRDVATKVPDDRFLIETDSPYLAPTPHRGKPNYPLYVHRVAEQIAELKGYSPEQVAGLSRDNYYRLFGRPAKQPTG